MFRICHVSHIAGTWGRCLGVNCSLGPKDLLPIVEEISKWTYLPIVVKANAGLPDPVTNTYNVSADEFATICKEMLKFGAKVMGGAVVQLRNMLQD